MSIQSISLLTPERVDRNFTSTSDERDVDLHGILKQELEAAYQWQLAGAHVLPKFLVFGPEGDFRFTSVTNSSEVKRSEIYKRVASFMRWKFCESLVMVRREPESGALAGYYLSQTQSLSGGYRVQGHAEVRTSVVDLTFEAETWRLSTSKAVLQHLPSLPLDILNAFQSLPKALSKAELADALELDRLAFVHRAVSCSRDNGRPPSWRLNS
jgi:hypothetical protein